MYVNHERPPSLDGLTDRHFDWLRHYEGEEWKTGMEGVLTGRPGKLSKFSSFLEISFFHFQRAMSMNMV